MNKNDAMNVVHKNEANDLMNEYEIVFIRTLTSVSTE